MKASKFYLTIYFYILVSMFLAILSLPYPNALSTGYTLLKITLPIIICYVLSFTYSTFALSRHLSPNQNINLNGALALMVSLFLLLMILDGFVLCNLAFGYTAHSVYCPIDSNTLSDGQQQILDYRYIVLLYFIIPINYFGTLLVVFYQAALAAAQ